MLTLVELVEALPRVHEPPPFSRERPGVRYVSMPNEVFVAPSFEQTRALSEGTSVVVVSAPAAVGKSTLAEELARLTGAPLWDLAFFNVGDGTFEGTLSAVFGMSVAADFVSRLHRGEALVVIDALDEGELRAGGDNFEAFLRDLATLYREPRSRPTLILLARAETAELVSLVFEVEDVPFSRLQVDFFDERSAHEFLDKRLDRHFAARRLHPAHLAHREAFETARQELEDLVAEILGVPLADGWSSESVRTFLGYAPVLEAVATFLAEPNYHDLTTRLRGMRDAVGGPRAAQLWGFLVELVEAILIREKTKIGGNIRGQLQAVADQNDWNSWNTLYEPAEQCARVLNRVALNKGGPLLPVALPEPLRAPYEEALQTSVPQHPFLGEGREFANVVFREYLYAWGLRFGSVEQRDATRTKMAGEYLPTPLLARFVLALERSATPTIDPQDFGFVYESLRGQGREGDQIYLTMTSAAGGAQIGVVIAAQRNSTPDVAFTISDGGPGIPFLRRLSHAVVDVDGDVTLGLDGGTFVLGPEVELQCDALSLPAQLFRVYTTKVEADVDGSVVLIAARMNAPGAPPTVTLYGEGRLEVSWPDLAYPWVAHRMSDAAAAQPSDDQLIEAGRYLSRILSYFRSRGYGELGRHAEIIDNFAVGQSELAAKLRDFMIERGLIIRGPLYTLDLGRMDELGINWADIRGRRLSPTIRAFLNDFLSSL